MINVSNEYKSIIDGNNREFTFKLVFTFADGTSLTVDDKRKLMSPGLSYDGATSSTGSFDIGSAIITKMDISLNNKDGEFDAYTWKGASVVVYVGLVLSDHTEVLKVGTYYVDKAVNGGVTKVIKCLGALSLMDKDFATSSAFPSTVYQAYYDACTTCGVLPAETSIECGTLAVEEKPDGVTCREIAGYAAMLSGGVVCEDPNGKIYIKHYDSTVVKSISRISSRSIEETDITITGIQASYGDEVYQSGTEDYALTITDNPLISSADSAEAAAKAALKNLSAPFRPLTITSTLDPALQPGDRVEVITGGKTYTTYATSVKWTLNGGMTVTCGAKTESDQSSDRYGAVSKTIITSISKQVANEAINAYDLEATQLNAILTNAMGFYETTETLEDGSQIKYVHDKPELADSQIIYKRTVDGFGYSTDGGQTYTSGWTADGNILAKVLTVIGIDADWIRTGDLTVGGTSANADGSIAVYDTDNNIICQINKDGFRAIIGAIAGWVLDTNELRSEDGTVRLNSKENALKFYSSAGTLLTRLNNAGLSNYDSNGILRSLINNTDMVFYDSSGRKRIDINSDGFNQYSTDGTYMGHLGRGTVYAVDSNGAITDTEIGEMLTVEIADTAESYGWAIFAHVPTSGDNLSYRRVYYCGQDQGDYKRDTFYINCDAQFLRHTESDPYYTKNIAFDSANKTFTVTAGCGAWEDTTHNVVNTFEWTEDASGNVTSIYNRNTGRMLKVQNG
jgi:hypothetical protein